MFVGILLWLLKDLQLPGDNNKGCIEHCHFFCAECEELDLRFPT